jgi:16S rRNA (adenine1518-N6/adenine1519-N6)-dimethyltransferase
MRHLARKRFGQHFLEDRGVVRAIIDAMAPRREDAVVEIGPGLGALTAPLLERIDRLHVVEIDRDLCARLRARFAPERLAVHEGDALEFDFATLPAPLRVVGNLPYNISTPLLFHLSGVAQRCMDLHLMLQKEVVDRLAAAPGSKDYGRLSVMLQYRYRVDRLIDVPASAFRPQPKVASAVVRLVPRPAAQLAARDAGTFARVVKAAFATRRKIVKNSLSGLLSAAEIEALGIDPSSRAEDLPVPAFIAIANGMREAGPG